MIIYKPIEIKWMITGYSKHPNAFIVEHMERYAALRIHDVVGQSEQLKAFADYDQKRMWEDGDKDLLEFVDEFLRL